MRIALVLAVLAALVGALWFVLGTEDQAPARALEPDAPPRPVDSPPAPLGPLHLKASERSTSALAAPDAPEHAATGADLASAIVVIDVVGADGRPVAGRFDLDCRDELARAVEFTAEPHARRRAEGVRPGEYTLHVHAPGHLRAFQGLTVRAAATVEHFTVALASAPLVRVRWQTSEGQPCLPALAASGFLPAEARVGVSVDAVLREIGAEAPNALERWGDSLAAGPSAAPWPGAPPDAVCVLRLASKPPGFLHASLDGTVIAAARVDDVAQDVVLRTDVSLVHARRAAVRFCLVDAETGAPIAGGTVSGATRAGPARAPLDVGSEGCLLDERYTAGIWTLGFRARGYAPLQRRVELLPGATRDFGRVLLERGGEVVVHAVRPDGSPASAVQLALAPFDGAPFDDVVGEVRALVSTDPEGRARFQGLAAGRLVLSVVGPEAAGRARTVEASVGRPALPIPLVVEPGVPIALDFGLDVAIQRRMLVYDSAGLSVAQRWLTPSGLVSLRLLPGEYVVRIDGARSANSITVEDVSVIYDLR